MRKPMKLLPCLAVALAVGAFAGPRRLRGNRGRQHLRGEQAYHGTRRSPSVQLAQASSALPVDRALRRRGHKMGRQRHPFTEEQSPRRSRSSGRPGPTTYSVVGESRRANRRRWAEHLRHANSGRRPGIASGSPDPRWARFLRHRNARLGDVMGFIDGNGPPGRDGAPNPGTTGPETLARVRRSSSPTPTATATATRPRTNVRRAPPATTACPVLVLDAVPSAQERER